MGGYAVAPKTKVLLDTTARTTASTFYGTAKDVRGCANIAFAEDCTVIAGSSTTSDMTIQHSDNGVDGWSTLVSFTQRTTGGGAAAETKQATVADTPIKRFVRTKQVTTTGGTVAVTTKVTMSYTRAIGSLPASH